MLCFATYLNDVTGIKHVLLKVTALVRGTWHMRIFLRNFSGKYIVSHNFRVSPLSFGYHNIKSALTSSCNLGANLPHEYEQNNILGNNNNGNNIDNLVLECGSCYGKVVIP